MADLDSDPLWYDRIEDEAAPPVLLHWIAILFASASILYGMPRMLLHACARNAQLLRDR